VDAELGPGLSDASKSINFSAMDAIRHDDALSQCNEPQISGCEARVIGCRRHFLW